VARGLLHALGGVGTLCIEPGRFLHSKRRDLTHSQVWTLFFRDLTHSQVWTILEMKVFFLN
jgi:hypothetical protein